MTVLRTYHWAGSILVALALHLLAFLSLDALPGFPQAARGGGLEAQGGDDPDGGAGLLVSLGKTRRTLGNDAGNLGKTRKTSTAPARDSERSSSQSAAVPPSVEEPAEPAPVEDDAETEVSEAPLQNPAANDNENKVTKAREIPESLETLTKPPPLPIRRPKAPAIGPEFEPFGRRLSAQGPSPALPDDTVSAGTEAGQTRQSDTLAFAANGQGVGRVGNASGREFGAVQELNYEDRVLLWLKRNGAYPREAYRFRQEGVVVLRFIVLRSGEIRHYNLVKSSGYYLLDDAVHAMMKRANPVPPIPPEVGKAELEFTIPVRFSREYAAQS